MRRSLQLPVILLAVLGCAAPPQEAVVPESLEQAGAAAEELYLSSIGEGAIGFDLVRSAQMVHGIAGDERFVFVTEVLNGRVAVYSRFTGQRIADIPAPPGGFLLPFTLRVAESGHLVVLDAGGFPDPSAPATPRVYDYDYRWNRQARQFEAELVRTVRFDGLPVAFTEDLEVTEDGTYVVSDSVLGSLWLIEPDGTVRPGLVPDSFAFGEGLPLLAPCIVGPTLVEGIPYDLGGGLAPGVGSLAASDGYLYWGGYCHGGIHRISMSTLRDTSRSAEERTEDIEVVSAGAPGTLELLKGLAFNRFDPDDQHLYATDCFNMQVLRIDVATGAREVVFEDPALLNFPVSANFAPPVFGVQVLLVASDQEHRFDALNFGIETDMFNPPFIAAAILMAD